MHISHICITKHLRRNVQLHEVLGKVCSLLELVHSLQQPHQDWVDDVLVPGYQPLTEIVPEMSQYTVLATTSPEVVHILRCECKRYLERFGIMLNILHTLTLPHLEVCT